MDNLIMFLNTTGKSFVDFCGPMLLQSSVLIVLLLVLDVLFLKKVRAVFRYCVWMLVLVKLVLPTTLALPTGPGYWFGDKVSFVKAEISEAVDQGAVSDRKIIYEIPAGPALSSKVDASGTEMRSAEWSRAFVEAEVSPVIENNGAIASAGTVSLCWQGFAFLGWAAAVAAMVLLLIQRVFFVKGLIAQSKEPSESMTGLFRRCQKQMKVRGKIELLVSPVAASPSVCGLFRPVVLMPQNLPDSLKTGDLRAVLLHELAHIKRGDLPVSLVQTILQIAYFYNPLLWAANAIIRKIREQAVDEMVLVVMGERAGDYPETLLNVSRLTFSRPVLSLRLIGVVESKKVLSGRIKHILGRPFPKSSKLGFAGLAAVIMVAMILLPMAKAASKEPEFIIKGTVTDAETSKPIAGAKVGDDKYNDGKFCTVTDADGNYEYKTWYEHHSVKAEAAGYKTQSESFNTKFFGSEKEKVIDFELIARDAGDVDHSYVTVEEGVGFDGIVFGCTGELIKSKLGEPDKEVHDEINWWLNYRKTSGLGFWVNAQENYLIEIRLNPGFKGKLSSGIGMSSTKKDVFDVYGEPINEMATSEFDERHDNQVLLKKERLFGRPKVSKIHYDQHGLLFWFEDERLNQIVVTRKATTESAAVTPPKVQEVIGTGIKEVYLPNYDGDRLQILDLESGELFDLPNVEDDFELFAAVLHSNKGEIVYDRFGVDGRRRIAHLNISEQSNGAITIADRFTYFWAEPGQIPRSETIMTRKGKRYKVQFVKADDKGCTIKFFPLSKAKVTRLTPPRSTRSTRTPARTPSKVQEVIEISVKEVYLPNYDGDRLQILDLESGELVDLPTVEDEFELFAAVLNSEKGEIIYHRSENDLMIAWLQIVMNSDGVISIDDYFNLLSAEPDQLPRILTITTRKGERYKVQFVKADDKGCTIKFFPLSKAKVSRTMRSISDVLGTAPAGTTRSSRTSSSVPVPRTSPVRSTRTPTRSSRTTSRTPSKTPTRAAAEKKAIYEKLQILRMRQAAAEKELERAEEMVERIRRGTTSDLEDRGYPHPITARLTRLQKERDDCVLEIGQILTKLEVIQETGDLSGAKEKAELDLAVSRGKLVELEKMVEEAKSEEMELNNIRFEYQRHVVIREERRGSLNKIKAQIEQLEIAYMEAGMSVSTSTSTRRPYVTTLEIKLCDRSKGEGEETIELSIPLAGLEAKDTVIPEQAQKQMDKYGITLEGIVEKAKNGLTPTTLLLIDEDSCRVEISVR